MYLSQLKLDYSKQAFRTLLSDVYSQHQFVLKGFGAHPQNVLFRFEPEKDTCLTLLVQSEERPQWDTSNFQVEIKEYVPHITDKALFHFRVRVNPTKRYTRNHPTMGGKYVGVSRQEDFDFWFNKKAQDNGFKLLETVSTNEMFLKGNKRNNAGLIQVQSWLVNGLCEVADSKLFYKMLCQGLGRSKCLGFGLFSISRYNDGTIT